MTEATATTEFYKLIGEPARSRIEEINRQTGVGLAKILEALVTRGIDDVSPATLRKLFPEMFGENSRTVVAVTKDPELGRIRIFSDGTWESICERIVLTEDVGNGTERRLWSDGKTELVSA